MRTSLSRLCTDFIEDRDIIRSVFFWDTPTLYPVCAAVFTGSGTRADADRLKRCRDLLKEKTGLFSNFRSTVHPVMLCMMATDDDPEQRLDRSLQVYDALKEHFWTSTYLPVASMMAASSVPPEQYAELAARTRRLYERMKQDHPFLTSSEDSVFAAMLALSDKSDDALLEEAERCYQLLKPKFFSGNAVQSLSHVLALADGRAEEKCDAVLSLFEALKARGRKYGTDYELATLGVLATLPVPQESMVEDILEVDEFLSRQKGYGLLGISKPQRLMQAGMLVTTDLARSSDAMQTAAIGSTIALVIAQEVAMCAAIAAATASTSHHASSQS